MHFENQALYTVVAAHPRVMSPWSSPLQKEEERIQSSLKRQGEVRREPPITQVEQHASRAAVDDVADRRRGREADDEREPTAVRSTGQVIPGESKEVVR